jgi:hypothetical protein
VNRSGESEFRLVLPKLLLRVTITPWANAGPRRKNWDARRINVQFRVNDHSGQGRCLDVMSHDSKFPDPKNSWHRVLERLYHEDHILYARMNNFSTVQAFLATALAFTTSATTTARNISLIVSLFGFALSLFYISLGFRGVRVIQFWRAYLRLLESIPGVTSIDSHLFRFYRLGHSHGPGETELPLAEGLAIKIETAWWARRSVHDQFPWYLPGFSGTMFIAVGIPMITTSFWVLVLYALFYPRTDMRWFVLTLAGGLVLVFLAHLLAGRLVPAPIREGQTQPAPAGGSQLDSKRF